MVAERTEKEELIGSSRRKVETSSPGPIGEEEGGVENVQWYIGRRDLDDWIEVDTGRERGIENG